MLAGRLRTCLLTAVAAAVAATVCSAGAASASGRDPNDGSSGGGVNEDGDPTAVAVDPGTDGYDDTTPGSDCYWTVIIADDSDYPFFTDDGVAVHSKTGRWVRQYCDGEAVTRGWYWAVPEGGAVVPADLAQQAAESVAIAPPVIGTSPASGRLVVQVPTWLWVDDGWWETYSATATAGRVSATVTATPVRATWSMGEGSTLVCDAGIAWHPGLADAASDCAHTYTRASTAAGYTMSVTVELELGWSSNFGESGTIPTISRTQTQIVQVGEIQAVGTR